MVRSALILGGLAAVIFVTAAQVRGDVFPNALFTDGMVLQQNRDVAVWGTADPDEKVVIRFRGQDVSTTASGGHWLVKLKSGSAGGPFPMSISGRNTLEFKNVRVGEVWLCSGQSNMWFPVAPRPGSKERKGTENPDIRLFTVPQRKSDTAQTQLEAAHWEECGPDTVGNFSAVAYYFGRDLQKDLKVPIGLIHASYGGSSAMYWINPEIVAASPDLDAFRQRHIAPVLYNGMIAPLIPYGIRGVIWYQGEADTVWPSTYRAIFSGLIRGWRERFGQGDFPFLFVQIAPYKKIVTEPQESQWAELREAQRQTSLTVPNTAMVVITDWGHETDIHVKPKEPVGQRMALTARGMVYGEKIVSSGPTYAGMKIDGDKIILTFQNIGTGLETRAFVMEEVLKDRSTGESGGALHVRKTAPGEIPPLTGFTISGADPHFVNAHAEIHGDTVVVSSPQVSKPVAVRFGWADYPTGNLFNKEGFPASPFRTDEFPLQGKLESRK